MDNCFRLTQKVLIQHSVRATYSLYDDKMKILVLCFSCHELIIGYTNLLIVKYHSRDIFLLQLKLKNQYLPMFKKIMDCFD